MMSIEHIGRVSSGYEVAVLELTPGRWRVEAIDAESGEIYMAEFFNDAGEERARQYAATAFGWPVGPDYPR